MDFKTAITSLKYFGRGPLSHPTYLIFFVTSKCSGRCKHCFYWESLNKEESPLTPEEVEKVSASMGPLLQVTFTGGEPFLRDDFPRLVETFYRNNKVYHLGIATNGFHPERVGAGMKQILEACPRSNVTVGLPIEGPPELNDEIRGRENFFKRTAESLERLRALKRAHPNLTILVDVTASAFNAGRLVETYKLVRDEIKPDAINLILTRGVPMEEGARELDTDEVAKVYNLMEEDIRKGAVRGYGFFSGLLHAKDVILRRMALDIYRSGSYHLPCEAGRVAGVLLPEGEVFPCELWPEPIGSVRESGYDFPALWNSEKARAIRGEILSSRCSCYHQCFLSNTIFFNLRSWPSILWEYARIQART